VWHAERSAYCGGGDNQPRIGKEQLGGNNNIKLILGYGGYASGDTYDKRLDHGGNEQIIQGSDGSRIVRGRFNPKFQNKYWEGGEILRL